MRRYDLVEIYAGVRLTQIFWPVVVGFGVGCVVLIAMVGNAVIGEAATENALLGLSFFGISAFVGFPVLAFLVVRGLFRTAFPKPQKPSRVAPRGVGRVEPRLYG